VRLPDAPDAVRPLSGIRVLAVEQMIAAPWATQMLARLGAEVLKVEHPTRGESGRASTPTITGPDGRPVGVTFIRNNLNKRSIGIDVTKGADLVLDLAERCDVFVQNSKPGVMEAAGLGYAQVQRRNPAIIYVSISGFGETTDSPYRGWPAYAAIAEAMSGIYQWARQPGQLPVVNPVGGLGDIGSAMFAVIGVLSALVHRAQTGLGQHVDVAMYDAMLAIADVVTTYASLGATQRAPGAIISTFAAADGDVVIQVSREHQFERLARIIGCPEWLADERLATRDGWVRHREDVIRPAVEAWSSQLPKLKVAGLLAEAGIPAGPCNDAADVIADPHVALRDMLVAFDRGDGGTYVVPGNPVKLGGILPLHDRRAPWLGEDTTSVLTDLLGLDDERLAHLRAAGVIG
jgi:crotonobetainyl-CoA:carnitine CoA-transferase CaiB-like acyl-CoA transferase